MYQNLLLLVASYFFYGWWSYKFLGLLALSTFIDYLYGFGVSSSNKKKSNFFLWLSIINNLGILMVFKYFNFFSTEFSYLLNNIGFDVQPYILNVVLPIGISFYTFHGMSYVFDIYRKQQKPITNFVDYAVFVSFFPLLVAGPIERANHLLPQVQKRRIFNAVQATEGCKLILWGMFKKVVIADSIGVIVNAIFDNYENHSAFNLLIGAVGFSFQIYGDFSGYSDIALGTAKLFGFELLSNFKFPYFSRDIAEFWRRWHISLSSWFRDYLYIPLGGSKSGKWKAIRNTFIIFLVSGFWHGASWNYIVWGLLHAIAFMPLLISNKNRKYSTDVVAQNRRLPLPKELFQVVRTFIFVTIAWIFFRADTLSDASNYLIRLAQDAFHHPIQFFSFPKIHTIRLSLFLECIIYVSLLVIGDWHFRRNERRLVISNNRIINLIVYVFLTTLILKNLHLLEDFEKMEFIYFQF